MTKSKILLRRKKKNMMPHASVREANEENTNPEKRKKSPRASSNRNSNDDTSLKGNKSQELKTKTENKTMKQLNEIKKENGDTVCGNANWYSHSENQYGGSLKS